MNLYSLAFLFILFIGCSCSVRKQQSESTHSFCKDSLFMQSIVDSSLEKMYHFLQKDSLQIEHILLFPPDSSGKQYPQSITHVNSGTVITSDVKTISENSRELAYGEIHEGTFTEQSEVVRNYSGLISYRLLICLVTIAIMYILIRIFV